MGLKNYRFRPVTGFAAQRAALAFLALMLLR
jgi:hypothetical protein